ncbi:glycosyltransferase family 4 protein [Candidatus Micrarchaeota archaeon]|nr:glycosyltransferase family 4 protein [Candidatus Micrarchaeota archaeon]
MRVAWVSDTFEQNNGVAVYLHETLPLLAKKVSVQLLTGRVLRKYPYPVKSLTFFQDPLLPDYDIVLPPTRPLPVDLIHAHSQYSLGLYAANYPGKRVVTAHFVPYHFLEFFFGAQQPQMLKDSVWQYEIWLLNHFDRVVCQTRAGANMFRKQGLRRKVEVIPNGINLDKYKHVSGERFKKKYKVKKPFALFIGRLDASKQPHWILETARKLKNIPFLISGSGTLESQLKRDAPGNVKFMGRLPREDLLDAYAASTALLMPSAIETEGLVAQEAMACGTPAFISPLDVLKEVVGKGGFVCKNSNDMAVKLEQYMDDRSLQNEMKVRALQEIKKRELSRSIDQLVKLYLSMK